MKDSKLRIVVSGLIAQYPLGGVSWDYLQYVIGISRLGHDVIYLEDTGQWPYNPSEGGVSTGCDFNVAYLKQLMERFGLHDRWAYRFPWESRWYGMSDSKRRQMIETADLLLNISGSLHRPGEYRDIPCLAYVDSDPVFTQLKLARGQKDFQNMVDLHDVHFSFGESISEPVPRTGHEWKATRQPVVLSEWPLKDWSRSVFTTIMNWTSYRAIEYRGRTYGQKDIELKRFMDLPERVAPVAMELAVNEGKTSRTPRDLLSHKGWRLADPAEVCPDYDSYRNYITSSLAEWSVAKNGYVVGQAGWFSCRSACYLASGRPVVVQDTGFGAVLPIGEGILAFSTVEEAAEAIKDVTGNYACHSHAARQIAGEYFDSAKVLDNLISRALSDGGQVRGRR